MTAVVPLVLSALQLEHPPISIKHAWHLIASTVLECVAADRGAVSSWVDMVLCGCREDTDSAAGQGEAAAANEGWTAGWGAQSRRAGGRRLGRTGGDWPGGGLSGILEGECSAGVPLGFLALDR